MESRGLQVHPAAEWFPLLNEEELEKLAEDIRINGQREPIVVHEGQVVDGRNRLRACELAGIDPRVVQQRFNTDEEVVSYVISRNLHRRHLSTSQRAMVAACRMEYFQALARDRQGTRTDLCANLRTSPEAPAVKHRAADDAARELSVSPRSVESAAKVKREAVPELVQAVTRGEVAVSAAAEVAKLPREEQAHVVAQGPSRVKEVAREMRSTAPQPSTVEDAHSAGIVEGADETADPIDEEDDAKRPHVANNSGNNEWYTPEDIVRDARVVMGGIDLDPASCEEANEVVRAERYFDLDTDGLVHEWHGRVWMNPPYSSPELKLFCEKLVEEFESGRIEEACVIVNNATETKAFQHMAKTASAICLLRKRTRFWAPGRESKTPLQGQVVLYFGPDPVSFELIFAERGVVCRVQN